MVLKAKQSRRASDAKTAALREAQKEPTIRLNVDIPERLHRALKVRAIEEGHPMTVKAVVTKALYAYLDQEFSSQS